MNKTSAPHVRMLPVAALNDWEIVVATELLTADGRAAFCPAAPLIAGSVARAGHRVHTAPVRLLPEGTPAQCLAAVAGPIAAGAPRMGLPAINPPRPIPPRRPPWPWPPAPPPVPTLGAQPA